jgi:acetyltransferase-like isoleucine patch superfamily enzyme
MLMSDARSKLTYYWRYFLVCRGNKVRFLRREGARIGQGVDILTSAANFGSEPWLIEIGHHVTIAAGVMFITHDGASRLFRTRIAGLNPRYGNRYGTIRIKDSCFVGMNAIILPDVVIGPDAIVGAGSVVTHNVAPGTVVAGNPARPICSLEDYIARHLRKMIPLSAGDPASKRRELTVSLWGEER